VPTEDEIREVVTEGRWRERFDDEALAVAARIKGRVRGLRAETDGDGFQLHAEVGGEPCRVDFWPEAGGWSLESECGCETGRFCPHAAALLLHLARPGRLDSALAKGSAGVSPASNNPAPGSATSPAPPDTPAAFHLQVSREPTNSRVVRLLLQALKLGDLGEWVVARPFALYGEQRLPLGSKPAGPDGAAEMNAILQLQQLGLISLGSRPEFRFLLALQEKKEQSATRNPQSNLWFPDPAHGEFGRYWPWLRAEGARQLEAAGWTVAFDAEVGHEVLEADDFHFALEDPGGGWFELSVGFDLDGERHDLLPILAELLERDGTEPSLEFPAEGHLLHHLDDGRALRLPAARIRAILRQFAALLDPRRFRGSKLQLHALDAATLSQADPDGFTPPKRLENLIHALHSPVPSSEFRVPGSLRAQLRDYQRDGFQWLRFLAEHELHGILADDMGLGKTLQTLAHILAEKEAGRLERTPALVVAPTSVVPNWRAEAKRFAPALTPLVLEGPQRKRYFRSIPHADLVLTSYALLQRDIDELRQFSYHLVVLDEAQHVKNPAAKVSQAACRLEARHRLCLSGTPVENHLGELWSLMRFLMPGFLGGQEDFRRRFRKPIEDHGDEERAAALKARVAPLILRRTKDQVAKELPPKTILVHPIELNSAQKDLYETVRATMDRKVRQAIAARGLEGSRMLFLEALLKLRQICCEPKLLKLVDGAEVAAAAGSAKLDYLAELLDTLVEEGRRVLLFSQFTSMLELIAAHLRQRQIPYLTLTGASKDRGALVERFQQGETPLFLISLKAGGTGLNLTAADTVIHYDPWWNPAAENQATDRAYRIGQTQPVFVHKLICQGTVEERIHRLQQEKSALADTLLADADHASRPDPQTLAALLAPLG